MKPLVCICIPTYNAAKTIQETLESILSQTYSNLIVHISDNASTDDTLKILETFHDPRLHIHAHAENVGGEGNFTRCLQMAEGEYTAIYHADDVYEPVIIEKQVDFLESHKEVGSVFTQAITIDEFGNTLGKIGCVPGKGDEIPLTFEPLLKMMLLHHNFLVCPSVLVRTDIYKNKIKVWGGDLFKSASDIDTWLRLSQIAPIAVLAEPLMRYRISSDQFSDRIRNRTKRTDFFLVMDHYLEKSEVRKFLTTNDFRHYQWLERHESVACAINLLRVNKVEDARVLLKKVLSWDAIFSCVKARKYLLTLVCAISLQMLVAIRLTRMISVIINLRKGLIGKV